MAGAGKIIGGAAMIAASIWLAPLVPVVGPALSAYLAAQGAQLFAAGVARSIAQEKVRGLKANLTSTQAYLPVVYGKMRVGFRVVDTRVVDSTDPDTPNADPDAIFTGADDDDVLIRVGAFCLGSENGSGVVDIDEIRLDGQFPWSIKNNNLDQFTFTGVGNETDEYPFDRLVHFWATGKDTQTTAPTVLQNQLGWDTDMAGQGIAYAALAMFYDEEVYRNGIPTVTALITGNRVYDPRNPTGGPGSDGWDWSDNPALCILDYLTSKRYGCAYFYPERDGGATADSQIDESSFISAANYCDALVSIPGSTTEKRFTLNGGIDTSRTTAANLRELLSSCRGALVWQNGKVRLVIRQATAPVSLELTEDNITGDWQFVRRGGQVANTLEATYLDGRSGEYDMNSVVWPVPGDSTLIDADNGLEVRREIELPFTEGRYRALRIAMVTLRELRQDVVVAVNCHSEAMALEIGDVVQVTHETPGWDQKQFWVVGLGILTDGDVRVSLQEYDANAYTLDTLDAEDTVPGTNLPNPGSIAAPTGFTAQSGEGIALVTQDDDIIPRIKLTWTAPADPYLSYYVIQMKLDADPDSAYETIARPVPEDTQHFVVGVTNSTSYDFRIRAVNRLGVKSDWATIDGHTVSTVGVSKIRIVSEGLRSAGINVANNQIWHRVLELYAYPGVVSFHVQIDSWDVGNLPNSGTTSVGPIDYDINLTDIGVTAGQSFTHVIQDGTGDPYEFDIKYYRNRIISGYDFGHTIRVTPYDDTGGEGGTGDAGTERVVVTKKISEYDSVGIRTEEEVQAVVFYPLLIGGPTGYVPLGGSQTYERIGTQRTTTFAHDVSTVKAYMRAVGSPTGSAYAIIYNDSAGLPGTPIQTSQAVDVSTISTSAAEVEFTFATPPSLSDATTYHYAIQFTGGDGSNYVEVAYGNTTIDDRELYNGTSWSQDTSGEPWLYTFEQITIERFGRTMTPGTNLSATLNASGQVEVTSTAAGGASALDDLTDVTITTPSGGQYLRHNGAGQFVNSAIQTGDITQAMVTQHEAALTILESQITDANILARIAGDETITGDWTFQGSLGYDLTDNDVAIGGASYGIAKIGSAYFGRTDHTAAMGAPTYNLNGTFIFQNPAGPVTGDIEFGFLDSAGLLRFALPKSAVGNATYNPRSLIVAGPAIADSDVVTLAYWQGQGLFDNLTMDTGTSGADLGVQNDLEVEGQIFVDAIAESTTAAGVTFTSKVAIDLGTLSGYAPSFAQNIEALYDHATNGYALGILGMVNQTVLNGSGGPQGVEGYAITTHATGNVILSIGTVGNAEHNGAGTLSEMRGGSFTVGIGTGGAGNVTTGKGVHIAGGFDDGAGSITTLHGLYIDPITLGGTNYAIYTNAGEVRFGDRVVFGTQYTASADITGDDVQLAFEWKPAHTTNDKVTANFFSAYQTATNAGASARLIGLGGYAYLGHPDNTTYTRITGAEIGWGVGDSGANTGDVTTAEALFVYGEDYGFGSGTIGTLYHIRMGGWLSSATTPYTVTTEYGIFIPNINTGATAYAIYTNAGGVSFGDDVTLRTGSQMIFAADGWDPTAVSTGAVAQIDNATLMGYTGTVPRRYSVRHIWDALDLLTAGTPTTSEYIPFYDAGVNAKKVTVANLKTAFALTAADIGTGTFPSGQFDFLDNFVNIEYYPTGTTARDAFGVYLAPSGATAGTHRAAAIFNYTQHTTGTTAAATGLTVGAATSEAGTVTALIAVDAFVQVATGGGSVTDAIVHRVQAFEGTGFTGDLYGLKIENLAGKATGAEYAIYTNGGLVRIGDDILYPNAENAPSGTASHLLVSDPNDGHKLKRIAALPAEDGNDDYLKYNSSAGGFIWGTIGVGVHSLEDHDDVTIATPTAGHFLRLATVGPDDWQNTFIAPGDLGATLGSAAYLKLTPGGPPTMDWDVLTAADVAPGTFPTGNYTLTNGELGSNRYPTGNSWSYALWSYNEPQSASTGEHYGMETYTYTAHTTGNVARAVAVSGWAGAYTAGTLTEAVGGKFVVERDGSGGTVGAITTGIGVLIDAATGATPGTDVFGTLYGLKIEDMRVHGTTDYAIYTGTGEISFGDNVTLRTGAKLTFAAVGWDASNVTTATIGNLTTETVLGFSGSTPERYTIQEIFDAAQFLAVDTALASDYIPFVDTGDAMNKTLIQNLPVSMAAITAGTNTAAHTFTNTITFNGSVDFNGLADFFYGVRGDVFDASSQSTAWSPIYTSGNTQYCDVTDTLAIDLDQYATKGTGYMTIASNTSGTAKTVTWTGVDIWIGGTAPSSTINDDCVTVVQTFAIPNAGNTGTRVIAVTLAENESLI